MKPTVYRKERILEHLKANSFATVAALAKELNCSKMTIRRDLAKLEEEGLLERSHGGASTTRRVALEFAFADDGGDRRSCKEAIARIAAGLIEPGQHVLLDTGTTTLELARALCVRKDVSVVTTSLAVVSTLMSASRIECMLLGGLVRESSPDLYGPLLEDNLSRIHPDWAFVGCDGISVSGGLTTKDPRVARATSLMVENAHKVALLVDSTKAGHDAFVTFASIDELDYIITDEGMPDEILEAARAAGVETIVAEDQSDSAVSKDVRRLSPLPEGES